MSIDIYLYFACVSSLPFRSLVVLGLRKEREGKEAEDRNTGKTQIEIER